MEGAAQSLALVSNVGKLVGKEFQQLRHVGGEIARMRNQLATMKALLRMESEADEGAVDHFIREWMKQLREVAYDAEDSVDLYLFRVRVRSGDPLFGQCKRLFTTLVSRRCLARDIKALRTLVSAINEEHARYGISLEPLRRTAAASEQLAVAAPVHAALCPDNDDPDRFVGNKERARVLVSKIKALNVYNNNEKKLKVFSIVGFGGLGKTTLALEVCRQLEPEFEREARVSVSQTFSGKDLPGLLRRVLRQIAPPKHTTERRILPTDDGAVGTEQANPQGNIDTKDARDIKTVPQEKLIKIGSHVHRQTQTTETTLPTNGEAVSTGQSDLLGNIDTMDAGDLERVLKEKLQDKRFVANPEIKDANPEIKENGVIITGHVTNS